MKKSKTKRGFVIYEFKDRYGGDCSLQKSSNAEEDQVWLGLDLTEMPTHHATLEPLGVRMLIDRDLAAKLALKLAAFAETGEI
jgi:hypothetical protein